MHCRVVVATLLLAVLASPLAAGIAPGPILSAAPSQYVTVDGARVHYKSAGKGRSTIVFVHGWGGNMNVWREQVAALHAKARLIVIDLPGHGGSQKPASYSMRGFAKAVNAVLTREHVEHAILVGHSMGALVVRTVERFYPARSRAVVTVDGPLRNVFTPDFAKSFVDKFRGDDYQTTVGKFFDMLLVHATPELRDEVKSAAVATPHEVLIGAMEALTDPAAWTEEKMSVPLLCVVAASPNWNAQYEEFVRGLSPDTTYASIDGVDHFLMIDAPKAFNETFERFLAAHKWIR